MEVGQLDHYNVSTRKLKETVHDELMKELQALADINPASKPADTTKMPIVREDDQPQSWPFVIPSTVSTSRTWATTMPGIPADAKVSLVFGEAQMPRATSSI